MKMNNKTKLHMSTDEFRKAGYKAIDWIADYYEKIEDLSGLSTNHPILSISLLVVLFIINCFCFFSRNGTP